MPATPLTAILQDFRSYRPGNHREFLEWVHNRANTIGLKEFALKDKTSTGELYIYGSLDALLTLHLLKALYLHALNQVRDFRWRHWCFTREYILKKTSHPTATGGSPIVTVRILYPHSQHHSSKPTDSTMLTGSGCLTSFKQCSISSHRSTRRTSSSAG